MGIVAFLQKLYGRETPFDPALWHKWRRIVPVRLTNGRWSSDVGQLWRRQTADGWEYKQDEETAEDWETRNLW